MDLSRILFGLAVIATLTSISVGLRRIAKTVRNCRCDGSEKKQGEVTVMFLLDATHGPVNFGPVSIADIRDAEGNEVPRSEVAVQIKVSDPTVLGFEYDPTADAGVLSFGAPGESTFTVDVVDKDDPSELLATASYAFKLIAGDPASVGAVSVAFEGISEVEPPEEPGDGSGAEG